MRRKEKIRKRSFKAFIQQYHRVAFCRPVFRQIVEWIVEFMDCPHVSDEELLAFAFEGEPLHIAVRHHFDTCLSCQQRVAFYQRSLSSLIPRLYRLRCPSATTLSYYCLPNALSDFERRKIAEHVARCPLCARELAETREFLAVS